MTLTSKRILCSKCILVFLRIFKGLSFRVMWNWLLLCNMLCIVDSQFLCDLQF